MTTISSDELPNRAFQLAYFLHRERKTAVEIATRALNKLQLAATAQGKRLYYRLTGRADARKARSKVSMGEPHLLQRLVYVESEEYERRKEAAANNSQIHSDTTPARQSDLVVYFIKHLVRITTRRNSFYVTLGLSRLLYNYTTPETMELYNLVIQDPDRVHDDYYYRSRKGLLLKELKERFGALVEVTKGARGEQRWRASENAQQHHELVSECLRWFTPWSTPCVVPDRFNPFSETITKLTFEGRLPDEEHEVEVNRIHATLHPDCFARLVAANRLTAPDERLELPHFFLANDSDDPDDSSRTPSPLSEDELRGINALLAQEAARRKTVSVGFLRVLVDGIQLAEIDPEHSAEARFGVDEEAEVIEVYGDDQRGPLLLATHLLSFNGADSQNHTITLEGGQRLAFSVNLLRDEGGSTNGARVEVAFKETAPARATSLAARRLWTVVFGAVRPTASPTAWWRPVAAFSVLVLLFAGAWWVWTNRQNRNEFVRITPTPAPNSIPTGLPTPVPTISGPGKPKDREQQSVPQTPINRAPQNQNGVSTPPVLAQRDRTTPERDETIVERSLLPDTTTNAEPGEVATRGAWNREVMGKPLSEVARVHAQITGDSSSSQEFSKQLQGRLSGGSGLQLADSEGADAALKISVRPASQRAGDSRVIVIARVANANGYVVWPASRRGSSWRYVGQPRYVAQRLVADLAREIEGAKRR
jgi:hypothetical protein